MFISFIIKCTQVYPVLDRFACWEFRFYAKTNLESSNIPLVVQLIMVQSAPISWSCCRIRRNSKERLSSANKELRYLSTSLRSPHHSCSVYFLYPMLIQVKHEIIRTNPHGLLLACCLQGHWLSQTISIGSERKSAFQDVALRGISSMFLILHGCCYFF